MVSANKLTTIGPKFKSDGMKQGWMTGGPGLMLRKSLCSSEMKKVPFLIVSNVLLWKALLAFTEIC